MDLDWARLGRALADARGEHGLTQDAVAGRLDVGRTTVQKIERGQRYQKVQPVHRAYARLVGWTPESVDAVLGGGDPARVSERDEAAAAAIARQAAPPIADLSVRILEALTKGGPLLDSEVMTFRSPTGREVTAVVIARTEEGSPEDLSRDLRDWQARIDALRREPDDLSSSGD